MDPFLGLLVVLFVWGPAMGQVPNSACYLVNERMEQARPCRPWETR